MSINLSNMFDFINFIYLQASYIDWDESGFGDDLALNTQVFFIAVYSVVAIISEVMEFVQDGFFRCM
jgi:hypothetical protein